MSDIVDRLRSPRPDIEGTLREEAADVIERQAAEIERWQSDTNKNYYLLQEARAEIKRQTNEIGRLREALGIAVMDAKKLRW